MYIYMLPYEQTWTNFLGTNSIFFIINYFKNPSKIASNMIDLYPLLNFQFTYYKIQIKLIVGQ